MTLHEAYLKAKNEGKDYGLTLLASCHDYGDFWGFMFVPPTFFQVPPDKRPRGIGDVTVNKISGKIGSFTPIMDFDLYDRRQPIPIEQFAEYNVAI